MRTDITCALNGPGLADLDSRIYVEDITEEVNNDLETIQRAPYGLFPMSNPGRGSITIKVKFMIKERKKPLILEIAQSELNCYWGNLESPEVLCKLDTDVMEQIIGGRITFQRAFMSGEMQVKGDFRLLRMLDQVFIFESEEE